MCQEIIGINIINLQEEINIMYYNEYKKDIYSQNGEDGVLKKIINELGLQVDSMWLVDVGAYDGISYSNFRNLIEQGANAVLIEPCLVAGLVGGTCEEKYLKLKDLPKQFPKVKTLNHFTKIQDEENEWWARDSFDYCKMLHEQCGNYDFNPPQKTLDESLLEIENLPSDYDILNIDIDSYDHDVWIEHKLNPKIVIVEVNSGLFPETIKKQKQEGGYSYSDSLTVGNKKGYSCVCHTGNMIYVRNDLVKKLSIPINLINSLKLFDRKWVNGNI